MVRVLAVAGLALILLGAMAVQAQDRAVDVKTWAGQTFRLDSPSLEVFYTVVPAPPPGPVAAAGSTGTGPTGLVSGATVVPLQPGAVAPAMGYVAPQTTDSKQGKREQNTITFVRQGLETRVPLASVAAVTFVRGSRTTSTLPPYATREHYRSSATVELTDGSQLAADYVNLGTAVLRGKTPQGTVDIPWQDIEALRFQR